MSLQLTTLQLIPEILKWERLCFCLRFWLFKHNLLDSYIELLLAMNVCLIAS